MFKTFALAAALAAVAVAPASAAQQDFDLINQTGYTIEQVYVSPTNSNNWQEDVLGRDVMNDGEGGTITFNRSERTCLWDLKVVYDDGESAEWDRFDLCKVSTITIHYDRKTGETSAEYE